MNHDSQKSDELIERYRQASRAEDAAPLAATRQAVLAEAARIAALRAHVPAAAVDDTRRAVNPRYWRYAVGAAAAVLAVVLMLPHLEEVPSGSVRGVPSSHDAPLSAESTRSPSATSRARSTTLSEAAPSASAVVPAQNTAGSPALLSRGDMPKSTKNTALLGAISSGNVAEAERLLDQGADVRQTDALGRTPLLLAVMQKHVALARLLLTRGADPNAADVEGETPLRWARSHAAADLVSLLEGAGAR